MNINLTPEQEQIINDEVKLGHFRSEEEVITRPSLLFGKRNVPTTTAITMTPWAKCSTLSRTTALLCMASLLSN